MAWSKTSSSSRGYGAEWRKIRKRVMDRDCGLCQCDQCQGGKLKITVATEVDHITPKAQGGTDAESNLRAVSHECHVRITAEQQGRKLKRKVRIGADGWPELE